MTDDHTKRVDDPRDQKKYVFHRTLFRRIFVGLLRFIFRFIIIVEVQGLDRIPLKGAVILAGNHMTNYDVFPMQIIILRPLFFMAKSELHRNPLMDAALRSLGVFPVYRGQRDQWAIHHAQKVLEHGQVLAMFPEGSRSKGRGLRAGKTGVARLAIQMNCPIIPVAIEGTNHMFKDFPRRTKINIIIGEPIYPTPHGSTLGLTDQMMFSIADMLPPSLRGVYAIKPTGFNTT